MNLTLHLIRKDLHRLRLAIGLWALFVVGQVVAAQWMLSHPTIDLNWFTGVSMLYNLLIAIGLFATYFLVAALVLEDPLMGTDIFWATRPIASGRLLTAKLAVVVLVFGLLPVTIWSVWWLASNFTASGIMSGTLRMLGLQLAAVIPALAVATLSANLGRLLVATFLQLLALFVALLYFFGQSGITSETRLSRVLLALFFILGTGIVVTGWMYRTRQAGRALLMAAAGAVLALVAAWQWPVAWPATLIQGGVARSFRTTELADAGKVVTQVESARLEADKNRDGYDDDFLVVKVRIIGLPGQVNLRKGRADVVIEWPDGTKVAKEGLWLNGPSDYLPLYGALGIPVTANGKSTSGDPETDAKIEQGRREIVARFAASNHTYYRRARNTNPEGPRSNWMSFRMPVSPATAERIRRDTPACRVAVRFETVMPEVLGELPLARGAKLTKRGRVELIGFAEYQRTRVPRPYAAQGIVSVLQEPDDGTAIQFWFVDKKGSRIGFNLSSSIILPVAPITGKMWWAPLYMEAPHLWRTDHWIAEPHWLEKYQIAVVALRPAGGFDRQMSSEKLTLASREEMEELEPASAEGGAP